LHTGHFIRVTFFEFIADSCYSGCELESLQKANKPRLALDKRPIPLPAAKSPSPTRQIGSNLLPRLLKPLFFAEYASYPEWYRRNAPNDETAAAHLYWLIYGKIQ
jgi:hypothetical protein